MNKQEILITGGSGTLGTSLVRYIMERFKPRGIRIFSRSELRQARVRQELKGEGIEDSIAWIIGDVRDKESLDMAMRGVDIVIHSAALKRIDTGEENPIEFVKTNIDGSKNVVTSAVENGVKKCVLISTDKAVDPISLYGATKMVAEGVFTYGNVYSGKNGPKFFVIRYGNVFNSNGSVVEIFERQAAEGGPILITDRRMTRFWIKKETVCKFIVDSIIDDSDRRLYIPKMRSSTILDLASVIAPNVSAVEIGLRCREKIHEKIDDGVESNDIELLMSKDELKDWIENGE